MSTARAQRVVRGRNQRGDQAGRPNVLVYISGSTRELGFRVVTASDIGLAAAGDADAVVVGCYDVQLMNLLETGYVTTERRTQLYTNQTNNHSYSRHLHCVRSIRTRYYTNVDGSCSLP